MSMAATHVVVEDHERVHQIVSDSCVSLKLLPGSDRQTDRQTDGQTDRQTDMET